MWNDKTCELCVFSRDKMCRRLPFLSQTGIVTYPNTSIKVNGEDMYTLACAEYKESN